MNTELAKSLINKLQDSGHECKNIDAKECLELKENGQKAEFIKDIVAMANNGEASYIIIGLRDKDFEPVGVENTQYDQAKINNILAEKIDPKITIELDSVTTDQKELLFITIYGKNPPYFICRDVIFSKADKKKKSIYRGMSFVRNEDRTDGLMRSDLNVILDKKRSKLIVKIQKSQSYVYKIVLSNQSDMFAESISLIVELQSCSLEKCPENKHKHLVGDNDNTVKDKNFMMEIEHLHERTSLNIAVFQIVKRKT